MSEFEGKLKNTKLTNELSDELSEIKLKLRDEVYLCTRDAEDDIMSMTYKFCKRFVDETSRRQTSMIGMLTSAIILYTDSGAEADRIKDSYRKTFRSRFDEGYVNVVNRNLIPNDVDRAAVNQYLKEYSLSLLTELGY